MVLAGGFLAYRYAKTLGIRKMEVDRRRNCVSIAVIALQCFDRDHGHLPETVIRNETGSILGSWRMAVSLYCTEPPFVDLGRSWDDVINRPITEASVPPFCFPGVGRPVSQTNIVAITGRDTAWDTARRVRFMDLPADLIVITEIASTGVSWASPGDVDIDQLPLDFTCGWDGEGIVVGFADGNAWYLDKTVPLELVRRFCTIPGALDLDRDDQLRRFAKFTTY